MSSPQNYRMLIIHDELKKKKEQSAESFARKFGVSHKTIHRDIKTMQEKYSAPIRYDKKHNVYYYTDSDYNLPPLMLTTAEIFGILIVENLIRQYKNTPYDERLRDAFFHLQKLLPSNIQPDDVSKFRQSTSFDFSFMRKVKMDIFEVLIDSIINRKQIKIYYYTIYKNERKWRTVDPYHLKNYQGEWYLFAYCHNAKGIRNFSPFRIEDYKKTDITFSIREDFDIEEIGKSFGIYKGNKDDTKDVIIWIDSEQSKWTREIIYELKEDVVDVKELEDASLIVTFRVQKTDEIKRWILQYGHHIKVLEPDNFRDEMRNEIKKMRMNYFL